MPDADLRPPIPVSLAARPVRGGLAVPWVNTELADGGSDFRSTHRARYEKSWTECRCQSCGRLTGPRAVLVCGPRQILHGHYDEPPACPPCALYASRACPMVAGRTEVYPDRPRIIEGHRGEKCREPGCDCGGWIDIDPEHSADMGGQPVLPWYASWILAGAYQVTGHRATYRCSDLGCEHERVMINGAQLLDVPRKVILISEPGAGRIWRTLTIPEAREHATAALEKAADVPDGYIAQAWDVMGRNQQHIYQILTKRHARLRAWMKAWADRAADRDHDKASGMPPMPRGPGAVRSVYSSGRGRLFAAMLDSMGEPPEGCAYPLYDWAEGWRFWPSDLFNVWTGVSVENQKWADIRVPVLLDTPAAVRWLSCEPLLGPLDLFNCAGVSAIERDWIGGPGGGSGAPHPLVDWVVVGGESGPGHRTMDLRWLESIVEQCREAEVPIWVKQDSGPRAGQQGRIPDELWIQEFPRAGQAMAR